MTNENKHILHYSGQEIDNLLDKIEGINLSEYQEKLIAGTNINIDPNTNEISATGGGGGSDLDLSGNSTVTVGGITAGTDLSQYDHNLNGLLQQMLAPTKWSFNSFICSPSTAGTYEYGATMNITAVTIERTNSRSGNINVTVGTSSGGTDLYSGTIAPSVTSVNLTSSKSYTGDNTGRIYCTISNGIDEDLTKTAAFTRAYYPYYYTSDLNSKHTVAQNAATKSTINACTSTGVSLSNQSTNQYIWFFFPDNATGTRIIEYYVNGSWYQLSTTTRYANVTITLDSGIQKTNYAGYCSNDLIAPGLEKIRIVNS